MPKKKDDKRKPVTLHAISIRQPFTWLVLAGIKDIENRTWRTKYRGRIYIHAPSVWDKAGAKKFSKYGVPDDNDQGWPLGLVFGGIVGSVEIVDCVTKHPSSWFGGKVGFVLKNPIFIAGGVPCPGQLGIWKVPQAVLSKIQKLPLGKWDARRKTYKQIPNAKRPQ
jgi:hypothetical protein